jgi:gliding motility-associated lipoprotein GldH
MPTKQILVVVSFLFLMACTQTGLYEKVDFFPRQEWTRSHTPEFTFDISDTASSYRIYFLLRHSDAYAYSNIWINIRSLSPGDNAEQATRFDIPLATDDRWLGSGMDDVFDHRVLLYPEPVRFSRKGRYTVIIQQDMRVNRLKHVLNAGLRLEKVN